MVEPQDVAGDITIERVLRDEFLAESRKQLFEDLTTTGQKPVRMATLRHAFARLAFCGQRIAIDNGYRLVMVRQCTGRQEAADARPDDDCMPSRICHFVPLSLASNPLSQRRRCGAGLVPAADLHRGIPALVFGA